ncbi:PAS domain S-box-containing protein/diguanylate cyclase (GGDEF)-like protein [Acidovorax sp. 56]|uniref:EAL domain-containing protein n=1 Tax=Acidovorax sp. 56 TaxID=2035205 RepID=UPI000C170A9C|nr:EAL domain-containing protein [Acidovorax sp. 56]PIF25294.1 PAS domain S-box-containing protein/diguanylate cyclase (GGDEF)-like protein [Acidovorax sp. 56]
MRFLSRRSLAGAFASDSPAVTVVLVVAALVLLLPPLSVLLGGEGHALHGVEPLMELASVLLGLLVVSVSLNVLDPREQGRSNVLVVGFGLAAVCNFLHGAVAHSPEGHLAAGSADVSLWMSTWARLAEWAALTLVAARYSLPGQPRAWAAAAGLWAFGMLWLASVGVPTWFAHTGLRKPLGLVLVVALGATAVWLYRGTAVQGRERFMAWAAGAFMCGELVVGLGGGMQGQHSTWGNPLAHGFRVLAYALLFQGVFIAGIRRPYVQVREAQERLRDSELRLQLLGRNLPHSVLYQIVREADGTTRFVHMGDAIERLNGVTAAQVLGDMEVLHQQIVPEDLQALVAARRESFHAMASMEVVVRMRRPDGELRWMRLSASPRALEGGRVIWDGVQSDITAERQAEVAAHAHEAQMADVLRRVPGGVARIDRDLRVLYMNAQQADWLQQPVQALEGQRLPEVISPWLMARLRGPIEQAFTGQTVVFEHRSDSERGTQYWRTTIVAESAEGQSPPAVVLFAYELTDVKRIELELAEQKTHLASVVNAMPDMVFLKDVEGVYLACNPVFERFAGRPERDLLGLTDLDFVPEADAQRFRAMDRRAIAAWQPVVYEETLTFAEDGYQGQFETIKTPIRDSQGRVTGVLGVCRDITDRKRAEQEIERLAFYDALTGLPNRRLLLDRLQRSIAAGQRTKAQGALLFIDLDNFKDLNDTLGHDMGDQLLSQVAARLVGSVREADTVSRFGGDEFVVMLENLSADLHEAATQAEIVADKLLASLNEPFALDGGQHYSTPSIGITLYGEQRLTVDELLKRADLAMYQAKAAGRNTQRFFDPDMQAAVNARSNLEADLRQGLARGELMVHYQPVVDHDGKLVGAEALARWRHPQRGMISPADFIPLAEQTGLILPLGQTVLHTACSQLAAWAQNPATAHLTLSVNVSARQFRQAGFVAQVLGTLKDCQADPHRLKLELTESLLLGDIEDTIERMEQLKKEGVGFALDDFGTGYSSLSYLKRLPLDQVKIDQSFVRDVLSDPNDAAIVRTILALAKSLDLEVVAEGVETAGQLGFLRLHGCEGFQGYLFGRPVPVDVFERDHDLSHPEGAQPTQPPPPGARA